MKVNHLVKMQPGWTHEKGRFGVYHPDLSVLDDPSLTTSTGVSLGSTLPSPLMNTDQQDAGAGSYAQNVRSKWQNAGCLYVSSGISEVETQELEFLDLKYGTYRSATFKIRGFVLDASKVGNPNAFPYAIGLWCDNYLIGYWPYYVPQEQYGNVAPTLELYLGGGYARNPINGDHCLICCPWTMFIPLMTTGYSPTPMQSRYYPEWHDYWVKPGYRYWNAGWSCDSPSFVREGREVSHSLVGDPQYDAISGSYAPYGHARYSYEEAPIPEAYAAIVKASNSSTPSGIVWYNSAAGFMSSYREKDVDI